MIDAKNVVLVSPYDPQNQETADKLGIQLPEIWTTDRYLERLKQEGLSMQMNPDDIITAFDRMELPPEDRPKFGILLDSLRYDEGPETRREYHLDTGANHWFHDNDVNDTPNIPFVRIMADPTPTQAEHSAELATRGFLLGSCVMAELVQSEQRHAVEQKRDTIAKHLSVRGIVAQAVTSVGNIVATGIHAYDVVPVVGSGAGFVVVATGAGARIATTVRSHRLKKEEIYTFAEGEVQESIKDLAKGLDIITFAPYLGDTNVTRATLEEIRRELDEL